MIKVIRNLVVCGLLVGAFSDKGRGAVVMNFAKSGADTVVTWSGSLDISGLNQVSSSGIAEGSIIRDSSILHAVISILPGAEFYSLPVWPNLFLSFGGGAFADSISGDPFGLGTLGSGLLVVPEGYSPLDTIEGEMRFSDLDLALLEVVEQTFSWGPGANQSIKISIVPEPSIAPLFVTALGAFLIRRRS